MQNNMEYCVYGEFNDEVRGVEEFPVNSLWDETVYYSAPLEPASIGSYFSYPSGDYNVYNSGYYEEPSYQFYHPLINYEYIPYYVYAPVYCYYFVPSDNYSLPRPEYVVSNSNSFEQGPFYESPLMSSTTESSLVTYGEYDSSIYNIQYGSFNNGSAEEIVGEAITTSHVSYVEYAEILDEAANDDKEESVSSEKILEENIVSNGADIDEVSVVGQPNEQPYDVYVNIHDEDIDETVIKKVSLMSIVEVQQDIDETYEYGKADVYNEVLKGYTVNKSILEYLEYESHTLDDIAEEEEPETDSDDMDFDENFLKNIHLKEDLDKNKLPDVDDSSHFEPDSLSEESPLDSSQEVLVDNCEIMMEEYPLSMDTSVAEEKDKSDPVLEHPLCEEKQYSGTMNANQEDYPPVDSPESGDKHKMISVPDICSSREEIHSGIVSDADEVYLSMESPFLKENYKMNSVPEVYSNKEEIDSRSVSIEEHHPPVDSPVTEENYEMNSVQDLCLSKEKIDSVSLGDNEEPHANVPSEDRGEETPVTFGPAASVKKQRKKRFSSLRKFFARICCCVKKPS